MPVTQQPQPEPSKMSPSSKFMNILNIKGRVIAFRRTKRAKRDEAARALMSPTPFTEDQTPCSPSAGIDDDQRNLMTSPWSGRGDRALLQSTTAVVNVLSSVAEAIPILGSSLKGAMEALCKVLTLIEQRFQNKEATERLADRLAVLVGHLSASPKPDHLLDRLRLQLIRVEQELSQIVSQPGVQYDNVAQYLTDCTHYVNSCMIDYTALTLQQMAVWVRDQGASPATEFITILDPLGFPQKVLRVDASSIQFLGQLILNRYTRRPRHRALLEPYIKRNHYEFAIDDGDDIKSISHGIEITPVETDTTIIMSVIMHVQDKASGVGCPVCHTPWQKLGGERDVCNNCERRVSSIISTEPSGMVYAEAEDDMQPGVSFLLHIVLKRHAWHFEKARRGPPPGKVLLFNSAIQKVFRGAVRPTIISWLNNDTTDPWRAEARVQLTGGGGEPKIKVIGSASAMNKKDAMALAASDGLEWIKKSYPELVL